MGKYDEHVAVRVLPHTGFQLGLLVAPLEENAMSDPLQVVRGEDGTHGQVSKSLLEIPTTS
jgi:hypothetical protein